MRISHRHKEWAAWKYLSAMTAGASLCFFVMALGKGWFISDHQSKLLQSNPKRRKLCAARLLSKSSELNDVRPMFGAQRHVTVRVAWNLLQLASLAQDEETFIEALVVLHAKLYKTFQVVRAALEVDSDTAPMLKLTNVARFLESPDARS